MLSKEEYYNQYKIKYQKIKSTDSLKKTSNFFSLNYNKLIFSFLFLSIPLLFTFFIDNIVDSESNNSKFVTSQIYNLRYQNYQIKMKKKNTRVNYHKIPIFIRRILMPLTN